MAWRPAPTAAIAPPTPITAGDDIAAVAPNHWKTENNPAV